MIRLKIRCSQTGVLKKIERDEDNKNGWFHVASSETMSRARIANRRLGQRFYAEE
jgi:hypothetical protein